ncbi:RNase A-like domain-containing protein [Dongia sp.]|uniref:RNase A-like domain-containing protein n=1 Tax=Dongia sp. TaxID=1977262 RepID=UPI0035B42EBE
MPLVSRNHTAKRPDASGDESLGEWQDGAFHFHSPEAERQWQVEAYRSGVHADDWHHGQVLDPKTRDVVLSGLGGPTPPYYRGPDGAYRFANRQTIEPPDVRELRRQSLQNVGADDLKGPTMPGEDVIAARFAAKQQRQSANDNTLPPANDNSPPAKEGVPKPQPKPVPGTIGRFADMATAQKKVPHPSLAETVQAIDDSIRRFANGATNGHADNFAAAANALFGSGEFTEDYEKNLGEERGQTEAARQRTGTIGAMIEAAPGLIPGYGDGLSLLSDAEQYIEHPETATVGNVLGTIVTALPVTPNALGVVGKIENTAEDAAKLEAKVAGKIDDVVEKPRLDAGTPAETPAIKPDQIRIDINDPASIDAYFKRPIKGNEGSDGHVIERHIGKTDQELMQRMQSDRRINKSSSFPDEATAERVIHDGLQQNRQKVLDWLRDPEGRDKLSIMYTGSEPIGGTVFRRGHVSAQKSAVIILMRDKAGGFHYHTAYPSD